MSREAKGVSWLTRRRRIGLAGLGFSLVFLGSVLWPRAVAVSVGPRLDAKLRIWQGALTEPSVADGGYFLQQLVNHYRSPPLPFPHRVPYRVRFEMRLIARSDGLYRFELDSPWDGALDIAERRVFGSGPLTPGFGREGEVELRAGVHEAVLWVQPAGDPDQPIRLLWKEPQGSLRPVNAFDLTLPGASSRYAFSVRAAAPLLWIGAFLVSLMTLSWVLESKGESKRSVVLAAAAVSAIALSARVPHFDTYPRTNIDESHNAWAGFNWIHEGHPRSWSWHPVYSNTRVLWFSYDYPIVPDAFDHTPFLPLLAGLEATVLGAQTMFDCVLPRIRPLMVLVGTLSVTIFFFLALELVSFRTAFLAATLMATSPLVVFNSRLVKEDGLVQLFLLLAVYAHLRSRRLGGGRSYWVAAVSSGLCAFAKVMGIAVGFALSAVCLAESPRRIRRPAVILAVSLFFASLYPLGGLALDWEAYRRLMAFFSASYPYESIVEKFLVLPRMILEPRISAAVPLVDGWIVLGWLAVFRLHRERAVSVPFVCYLLVLMITVRSTAIWGFYLSPLLPFLCLAAATAMGRALSRMDLLSVFLAIGLGFLPQYVAIPGAPIPGGFRGLAVIAFLPLVPALFRLRRDHPCRAAGRTYLAVLLMVSAVANLHRCITTL